MLYDCKEMKTGHEFRQEADRYAVVALVFQVYSQQQKHPCFTSISCQRCISSVILYLCSSSSLLR